MDSTTTKELSQEQLDRIKKNQQRARELRQEKLAKQLQESRDNQGKIVIELLHDTDHKKKKEEEDILEDFEIGASEYITKEQASKLYCLPIESIELCSHIVKENPKCAKFAAMKLFARKEVRKRARERFGGIDGLKQERLRREQKRLKKDMESCENVFESKTNA